MGASSLQRAATKGGLVLLYHSVFESLPKPLDGTIHNTTPETLRRQLEAVGREFTFVSVDELAVMKNPTGFAAVSFDDGYRCVLEEGLAVFMPTPPVAFIKNWLTPVEVNIPVVSAQTNVPAWLAFASAPIAMLLVPVA